MKKYDEVGKGRQIGVFKTWKECLASVGGYPGAEFKVVTDLADAADYLMSYSNGSEEVTSVTSKAIQVYLSEDFNQTADVFSTGLVFVENNQVIDTVMHAKNNTRHGDSQACLGT